jgi:hypothetical protein
MQGAMTWHGRAVLVATSTLVLALLQFGDGGKHTGAWRVNTIENVILASVQNRSAHDTGY